MKVDVHYYEDGNVRLLTTKPISSSVSGSSATEVVRQIASVEKKYQEDLNRAFTNLNEGAFKGLRRQLPVTRQKVEWEKIGGYRVSLHWRVGGVNIMLILSSWDKTSVVVDRDKLLCSEIVPDVIVQLSVCVLHKEGEHL